MFSRIYSRMSLRTDDFFQGEMALKYTEARAVAPTVAWLYSHANTIRDGEKRKVVKTQLVGM